MGFNIGNAGALVEILGIIVSIAAMFSFIGYIASDKKDVAGKGSDHLLKIGRILVYAQAALFTLAVSLLLVALIDSNFLLTYVYRYTNQALPIIYKMTALWAGQAGSLLLWAWLISVFAAIECYRLSKKGIDGKYQAFTALAMLFTLVFFAFLCTVVTSPFETAEFVPRDGRGMNPMLQDPGMIIHPPLLYIGFVGFVIPMAHAFAASCTHSIDSAWLKLSRSWTLITWVFLAAGVVLGAWWAYVELGWGGYWAWDPVENASLFPWIAATAFLHAGYIYERRNTLKVWSFVLVLITFELTIFATYLTRSGIMTDSVHSFGQSNLGNMFLVFIFVSSLIFIVSMVINRKVMMEEPEFLFVSREGIFFISVLVLVALTFVYIFYTMLPVITSNLDSIFSEKKTVVLDTYNTATVVFFIVIFFLATIGPLMRFGKNEMKEFAKGGIFAFSGATVVTIVVLALGFTKIQPLIMTFFITSSLLAFTYVGLTSIKSAGAKVILTNRRLFGAIIIHIGLVMVGYGLVYAGFYQTELEQTIPPGGTFTFKEYTINVGTVQLEDGPNYESDYVPLEVDKNGKYFGTLYPEIRQYDNNDNLYGEVAYISKAKGDLYFILNGYNIDPRDLDNAEIKFTVKYLPLLIWAWIGTIVMCIGGIYGATHTSPAATLKMRKAK